MDGYRDGNILSLTLTDFQIFRHQTFRFGPSLNLIAAPNGSGKSSIANALALVFGGTPRTIGKTRELTDFIRFGASEAVVEAELVSGGRTMRLSRVVRGSRTKAQNPNGTNGTFLIDGQAIAQREYVAAVAALGIDVGSLCSFLPQERVAEFCAMDPASLLNETLQGTRIALDGLYSLQAGLSDVDARIATSARKKSLVETTLARLEVSVAEHRARAVLVSRLQRLRYKRERLSHDAAVRGYIESKDKIKQLEAACTLHQDALQTARQKQSELEAAPVKKSFDSSLSVLHSQNKEIKSTCSKIKEIATSLDFTCVDHSSVLKRCGEKEEEMRSIEKGIAGAKNDIIAREAQFKDLFGKMRDKLLGYYDERRDDAVCVQMREKIDRCKTVDDLSATVPKVSDAELRSITNETRQIRYLAKELAVEIAALEEQKANHNEQGHQRMEMLKRYHRDTHTAVLWLRQNRHVFSEEILEPAFLHVTIHKDYASEIEALLGFQALSSFLVKTQDDLVKLSKALKDDQRLSINIAEVVNKEAQAFDRTTLERLSIDGVAIDFVSARKEYVNMLCAFSNLDKVPVSKKQINETDIISSLRGVRRMVIGGHIVEVRRSRYNSDVAISSTRITARGVFKAAVFDVKAVESRLESLCLKREENRVALERLTVAASEMSQKAASLKETFDLAHLRQSAYSLKEAVSQQQRLENAYSRACDSVSECNGRAAHCDSEIARLRGSLATASLELENLLKFSRLPVIDIEAVMAHECDLENVARMCLVAEARLKNGCVSLEDERKNLAKARSTVEETKSAVRALEREITGNCRKGDGSAVEIGDLPDELTDIEDDIHRLEIKLSVTSEQKGIEDEALDKENMRNAIDASLEDLSRHRAALIEQIEAEKKLLTKRIYDFITPVNTEFARMFARLGLEGRIELSAENGPWELHIMVRFRDGEELARLDSTRQSGGEKSLATALFLLALQQTAMAPFRLVDEINQGMDAFNERAIFEILREMSAASQFFIITPKLVDDLVFSDGTNAIVLYGGPGITKDLERHAAQMLS